MNNYGSETICMGSKCVEYCINSGHSWVSFYEGSICGTFHTLLKDGKKLFVYTSKESYYSANRGRCWVRKKVKNNYAYMKD